PQEKSNNPKKDTLDNSRKGQVIRFLYDQELIFSEREIMRREEELGASQSDRSVFRQVNLGGLDLVNVNLSSAFIPGIDLANTTLKNGNLRNTNLVHADLSGADLSNADLSGADLSNTILYATNLQGATYTDNDTPEEICLELGLIAPQSDRSTCPTQFPQGFNVSGQDMAPPLR
ncbi:MAG: pentapeptide repeat-containing protein, partial [Cyanobacteria bacterium P01_D01_bin.56]